MEEQNKNQLPIFYHKQQILNQILNSQSTIICGQTGCGKTTQVPKYLFPHFKRIIVTQPRRISAITLAQRVAKQMNVELGKQVGYSVRFQQKRSNNTSICFMTDGMAIRQLMAGRQHDCFIIDQAHQRSINTDVLMALLKSKQKSKKNRFKLVIMSATIQSDKFMDFFMTDSIIRVKGRTFPTQIYNLFQPTQNYLQGILNTILQIHYNQQKGDILAFLTGQDQILTLNKKLNKIIQQYRLFNLQVLMLYSSLPHQLQHRIFQPKIQGNRRVILATNIAQTSITINNLKYVIDSGFMKIRIFDNNKNIDMLTIVPISKANALQRSGRAGREQKGKCYRLYIKNDYDLLPQQMQPQILRSQLSGPILQLKSIGIPFIRQLQFIDQPSIQTINNCLQILTKLGCIDQKQKITQYGLQVSRIPLVPYLSNLLLKSYQLKCHQIMLNVISILSIQNLFYINKDQQKNGCLLQIMKKYMPVIGSGSHFYSDHLAKANILQQYIKSNNKKNFCKGNYINKNNIKRALLIKQQLKDYLQKIIIQRNKKSFFNIKQNNKNNQKQQFKLTNQKILNWLKCMQIGNPQNLAKLNKQGTYTIVNSGQIANIHPESLIFFLKPKPAIIVFNTVIRTTKLYLRDVTGLNNSF